MRDLDHLRCCLHSKTSHGAIEVPNDAIGVHDQFRFLPGPLARAMRVAVHSLDLGLLQRRSFVKHLRRHEHEEGGQIGQRRDQVLEGA